MGPEIGGYNEKPDWPKLGPSLLISTCLILAIRTAKWPARFDEKLSNHELEAGIDYATHLASRALSKLISKKEGRKPFFLKSEWRGISQTMRMCRSKARTKRAEDVRTCPSKIRRH